MLKTIQLPPSFFLITYYETLDEVFCLVRQKKLNKDKYFEKKLEKKIKFYQKNFKNSKC